jgi:methylmalonyl-CoA/ethylmalonyl-CoA epimerase
MTDQAIGERGVAHVGIVVRDIEASRAAWAAILGQPEPEIIVTDAVDVARTEFRGASSPARAKLAFFHVGEFAIELIEPIGEPSSWAEQLNHHDESLHHLAFRIQGMNDHLATAGDHGLRLVQRGEYAGGRYAYLEGPRFGGIVELLEDDQPSG